jgi:signal-transduction protein with cAMP-binding, CBS, and nucleotidyltransferase domain
MLAPMEPPADIGERPAIEQAILTDTISSLRLGPAIHLPAQSTLQEVVEIMQREHIGCMLLTDSGGRLCGIFTERDLLNKVAGRRLDWSKEQVGSYMTRDPESLRPDDRIVWALNLMSMGGYRHVPLTDLAGRPAGVVSIKDIVEFIVDLFPDAVLNLPPDPHRMPGSDDVGGGED